MLPQKLLAPLEKVLNIFSVLNILYKKIYMIVRYIPGKYCSIICCIMLILSTELSNNKHLLKNDQN